MPTKRGKKAERLRLLAKHGWRAGRAGAPGNEPTKMVMSPSGRCYEKEAALDEKMAYWDAYEEGRDATSDVNPYGA